MPPKTASQTPNDDLDTEIALFRYGLIAQILHDPPAGWATGDPAARHRRQALPHPRLDAHPGQHHHPAPLPHGVPGRGL